MAENNQTNKTGKLVLKGNKSIIYKQNIMDNMRTKNKNVVITDRDVEVFNALARYHLTGRMIFELSKTFNTPFTCVESARGRLAQLHRCNFLNRDDRFVKGRSKNESYYFLTRKSAQLSDEQAWLNRLNSKNAVYNPISLLNQAHNFLISQIMVKMEQDRHCFQDICQQAGFIRENHFEVRGERKRKVKPDGSIFLSVNGQNFLLFLEADRSTEVVRSNDPYKRTFERKIKIYSEFKNRFWQDETIHSLQGIKGYRVITICKSAQRLENLINLASSMNKSGMFWFTTQEWFLDKNKNCLFDKIWVLPNRQFYPLF